MRRIAVKRIWGMVVALFIFSSVSFSQFSEFQFLRGGANDGLKILEAYMSPWANAFGAGLNGGWYNTAKPHKLGGFDLTAGINLGFVPSTATTFDVSELGLSTLTGTGTASTVAGPKSDGVTLTSNVGGVTLASFKTPPGTKLKIMPVPTLQLGIGLPLGTELKVRYVPKINIGDGDIKLWGIGLLHSIMQYVPGDELLPFDISLFGGYTKMTSNIPLDLQPGETQNYSTYDPVTSFLDQKMKATVTALNIGVIGSVNLPVVTFYGGLGYSKTSTTIDVLGNYPLPTVNLEVSTTDGVYEDKGVVKDFDTIDIKNFSGVRANIGIRFKFSVITIHADYTRAQYNVFSTGFGISFR